MKRSKKARTKLEEAKMRIRRKYSKNHPLNTLDKKKRVFNRIKKDFNGCWIWQGAASGNGYGQIEYDYKWYRAHRFSWIVFHGKIPDGMLVCHKCDVKKCVNPDHLFVGTHVDNVRDMKAKGRARYRGAPTMISEFRTAIKIIKKLLADRKSLRYLVPLNKQHFFVRLSNL